MDAGRVRVNQMVGESLPYPKKEATFVAVLERLPDDREACTILPADAAGSTTTAWISAGTGSFVTLGDVRRAFAAARNQ